MKCSKEIVYQSIDTLVKVDFCLVGFHFQFTSPSLSLFLVYFFSLYLVFICILICIFFSLLYSHFSWYLDSLLLLLLFSFFFSSLFSITIRRTFRGFVNFLFFSFSASFCYSCNHLTCYFQIYSLYLVFALDTVFHFCWLLLGIFSVGNRLHLLSHQ